MRNLDVYLELTTTDFSCYKFVSGYNPRQRWPQVSDFMDPFWLDRREDLQVTTGQWLHGSLPLIGQKGGFTGDHGSVTSWIPSSDWTEGRIYRWPRVSDFMDPFWLDRREDLQMTTGQWLHGFLLLIGQKGGFTDDHRSVTSWLPSDWTEGRIHRWPRVSDFMDPFFWLDRREDLQVTTGQWLHGFLLIGQKGGFTDDHRSVTSWIPSSDWTEGRIYRWPRVSDFMDPFWLDRREDLQVTIGQWLHRSLLLIGQKDLQVTTGQWLHGFLLLIGQKGGFTGDHRSVTSWIPSDWTEGRIYRWPRVSNFMDPFLLDRKKDLQNQGIVVLMNVLTNSSQQLLYLAASRRKDLVN